MRSSGNVPLLSLHRPKLTSYSTDSSSSVTLSSPLLVRSVEVLRSFHAVWLRITPAAALASFERVMHVSGATGPSVTKEWPREVCCEHSKRTLFAWATRRRLGNHGYAFMAPQRFKRRGNLGSKAGTVP